MSAANPVTLPLKDYRARHIRLAVAGKVATITLDRPDKKNPITFESYAEIVDLFRAAAKEKAVKAFVVTGADDPRQDGAGTHIAAGQAHAVEEKGHLGARRPQPDVAGHR